MEIIPFEKLNVTTMTLVIKLEGSVFTDVAFQLLPIYRVEINQTRESSKCKLPHSKIPGSILSMRYRGNIRGIIRNKSDPFKNAVTIDISTTKKNISLKLSSFSIQMCGASSIADGLEAATHTINHLMTVQKILNKMQENAEMTQNIIKWIKKYTKGEKISKPVWTTIKCINVDLNVYTPKEENCIIRPQFNTPGSFDPEIYDFLLSMADDFIYHNDFCSKLDYIAGLKKIIEEPLRILQTDEAMVNYNFSLGFQVDRVKLNEYIDGQEGFVSRFNNALSSSVTIELPYHPPEGTFLKRRKNKIPHTTFLIYRSGSCTLSSANNTILEPAYYTFMNLISQLKPYIEYKPVVEAQ
jgi:hypothetical protein